MFETWPCLLLPASRDWQLNVDFLPDSKWQTGIDVLFLLKQVATMQAVERTSKVKVVLQHFYDHPTWRTSLFRHLDTVFEPRTDTIVQRKTLMAQVLQKLVRRGHGPSERKYLMLVLKNRVVPTKTKVERQALVRSSGFKTEADRWICLAFRCWSGDIGLIFDEVEDFRRPRGSGIPRSSVLPRSSRRNRRCSCSNTELYRESRRESRASTDLGRLAIDFGRNDASSTSAGLVQRDDSTRNVLVV
jgi:hypothetical protein